MDFINKHIKFLYLIISIILTFYSVYRIDDNINGLETDGRFNFTTSFNLFKHNKYNYGGVPTAYREPLPSFFYSLSMKIFAPKHLDNFTFEKSRYIDVDFPGDPIIYSLDPIYYKTAKYANIFFIFISFLSLSSILLSLNLKNFWEISIFPLLYYLGFKTSINFFFSEIHTIALLLLAQAFLIRERYLLSAFSFGFLALTKGIFFYIFPCFLFFLFFFKIIKIKKIITSLIVFLIIVFPWQLRNFSHFNSFSITNRSGLVMLIRAYANNMNFHQMTGFIADQSPPPFSKIFLKVSQLLGGTGHYLMRDKDIELNSHPDEIKHFYHKARAQRIKFAREEKEIDSLNLHRIDKKLRNLAIPKLISRPFKHIFMSFIFAYRGMWNFRSMNWLFDQNWTLHFFNLICNLSLLYIFIIGIYKRNKTFILISGLPVLCFVFYSLTSHFIPRYFFFFIPFQLICFTMTFQQLKTHFSK